VGSRSGFEWLGENGIRIILIEYEKILVAGAGGRDEFASLVGVDLTGGFHNGSVAVMTLLVFD
jgi:hypothetical protein